MSSRLSDLARAAGFALLVLVRCPPGHSQDAVFRGPDLAGWALSGATALDSSETTVSLPAGAQVSRVFDPGQSVAARVCFEGMLSEDPADVVSVQIGRLTLVLTRSGTHGFVLVADRDWLAEQPLLTVDLGTADGDPVSVDLSAVASAEGSTVRIEIAGEGVDWQAGGNGGEPLEIALSAGRSAPVRISQFEFVVDRADTAAAGNSPSPQTVAGKDLATGVAAASSATAPEVASTREKESISNTSADKQAEAPAAEPESESPPGRPGLEVFTPPSVRRHTPNANANPRAQEVAP